MDTSNVIKHEKTEESEDEIMEVKHEPSVEYLLIIPLAENPTNEEFPLPIKVEHEEEKMIKACSVQIEKLRTEVSMEKVISCCKCSTLKVFRTNELLRKHQQENHFKCKICGYLSKHLNTYKVHECKNERRTCPVFKCNYCPKFFDKRRNLAQHVSIHLKEMKIACKKCGKKFVKNRLRQHMEIFHGTKKTFECDLCGVKTKLKYQVDNHMMSHLRPYKCKICNKTFSESRYFLEHQLNHDKPNPFKCSKCSSSYTRKTSLNRHMQTAHSSARNFACTQCDYKGKTKDDLTTHIKSHTQAYKCDVCARKFSRSSLLKEHRILHDNPNAYQCKLCKLSFVQKKTLKTHMMKNRDYCEMRRATMSNITGSENDTESSSESD